MGLGKLIAVCIVLGLGGSVAAFMWPRGHGALTAGRTLSSPLGASLRAKAGFDVVHWRTRTESRTHGRTTVATAENWARLSSLVHCGRYSGARLGGVGPVIGAREVVMDLRGMLARDAAGGAWTFSPWSEAGGLAPDDMATSALRREALPPGVGDETTPAALRQSAWQKRQERLEGRPVVRWQREIRQQKRDRSWQVTARQVAWTDPSTGRLVRKQVTEYVLEGGGDTYDCTSDAFTYDQAAPPHTLDLTPPPGATVWLRSASAPPSMYTRTWSPSAADRSAVTALIRDSEAAWVRGDFGAFSGKWDFAATTAPEGRMDAYASRASWQEWMDGARGKWQRLQSQPYAFYHAPLGFEYTHRTPPPDSDAMYVIAKTTLRRDSDPFDLTTYYTYLLRHGSDGWRIVDWSWRPHPPMAIAQAAASRPSPRRS